MRHLILMFLVFYSLGAYGQDLIITSTGDSLKCKIVEVDADEIQFRFGASGNIITIKKSETALYEYNVMPVPVNEKVKAEKQKEISIKEPSSTKYTFYAAISVGTSTFGKVSFGKDIKGIAWLLGVDAVYFFHPMLGAGLKLNTANCDVKSNQPFSYHDRVMFYGPAVHGRFEKDRIALTICASIGGLTWKLSDLSYDDISFENQSYTSFGCFFSAGVNYMYSRNIGFILNVQTTPLGSLKKFERIPNGIGCSLGVNFRF